MAISFTQWTDRFLPPFDGNVLDLIATVRDVPFALVPDRTVGFLLRHGIGSCTAKHKLLLELLERRGWQARLVYLAVRYDSHRMPLHRIWPDLVTSEPFPHTAIQLWWANQWHLVDITLDLFVAEVGSVYGVSCRPGSSFGEILTLVPHRCDQLGRRGHLHLAEREPHDAKMQYYKAVNKYLASVRKDQRASILANEVALKRLVANDS